jgi:hypothetical protein
MSESTVSAKRGLQFRWSNEGAFLVALVVVVLVAFGARRYGWVIKKPVPWPDTVVVNEANRCETLPGRFGADYRALEPDDYLLFGSPQLYGSGGREGADNILTDDVLETLGVRVKQGNAEALASRTGNWYGSRIYVDTRPGARFRYWQLDVYYYTGLKDQVPHVPGICLVAGGAENLGEEFLPVTVPDVFGGQELMFVATSYDIVRRMDQPSENGVEYFMFIFNGEPVSPGNVEQWLSWLGLNRSGQLRKVVREGLASLETYNYFAKVQLSPLLVGTFAIEDANAAAEEFIQAAMPHIVSLLPSAQVVESLEAEE